MNVREVRALAPIGENSRNSEGAFLRSPNGDILFAYSRYNSSNSHDHAPCDIYMIRSSDEGESWSEPVAIAIAKDFGVTNLMSVSGVTHKDGSIGFYFLIKENDFSTTIGRAISSNGKDFKSERTKCDFPRGYYIINNDRFERFSDSRIVAPAAYIPADENSTGAWGCSLACCLVSEDDGATFKRTPHLVGLTHTINYRYGMQEPGIIELYPGIAWMWARTGSGYQYQCYSLNDLGSFTIPEPSIFTSPDSPMEVIRENENTLYCVYNPIPNYNEKEKTAWGWGRTPLVIRKSVNNGVSWGRINVIGGDSDRGYCYPSMFITKDGAMLCSTCSGGEEDKMCLCRLSIFKFALDGVVM